MSTVKPAMTAEEWREFIGPWHDYEDSTDYGGPLPHTDDFWERYGSTPAKCHAVAAEML